MYKNEAEVTNNSKFWGALKYCKYSDFETFG